MQCGLKDIYQESRWHYDPEDDAIPYMNEIGEITRVPKYEGGFYEVDFGEEGEEDFFEFLEEEMEVYIEDLY
jgi:hypothetical protein